MSYFILGQDQAGVTFINMERRVQAGEARTDDDHIVSERLVDLGRAVDGKLHRITSVESCLPKCFQAERRLFACVTIQRRPGAVQVVLYYSTGTMLPYIPPLETGGYTIMFS